MHTVQVRVHQRIDCGIALDLSTISISMSISISISKRIFVVVGEQQGKPTILIVLAHGNTQSPRNAVALRILLASPLLIITKWRTVTE